MNIHDQHSIEHIGDYILQSLVSALEHSHMLHIALSGGNTPKALFQYWVQNYSTHPLWHRIQYYWVDERCVAPQHEESNFGVAFSLFFEPLHIDTTHIHRMKGEENPTKEALRYHIFIQHEVPLYNGIPQFDCILLGIGDDGHTASIFPGSEHLFTIPQYVVATQNPYSKQWRITLTGLVINNAKHVMFIATGESKRMMLNDITRSTTKKYPAQHVHPTEGLLTLLTDIKL